MLDDSRLTAHPRLWLRLLGAAAILLLLLTFLAVDQRSTSAVVQADFINGSSGGTAFPVFLPAILRQAGPSSTATLTQTQAPATSTSSSTPTQTHAPATSTSTPTRTQTQAPATSTSTPTRSPSPAPPHADLSITALDGADNPEYVAIANYGNAGQDMTGWSIVSVIGSEIYNFPNGFVLAANSAVSVLSNSAAYNSPPYVLFWTYADVWYLYGDKAELRSNTNALVDTECYGGGCQ